MDEYERLKKMKKRILKCKHLPHWEFIGGIRNAYWCRKCGTIRTGNTGNWVYKKPSKGGC